MSGVATREVTFNTYQLRFRSKFGVESGFIEAASFEDAERIGKGWCDENRHTFLSVKDPVLVRQSEWDDRQRARLQNRRYC